MPNVLAVYHVAFEDLGSLGAVLAENGYSVTLADASRIDWSTLESSAYDLVVVLGGPIGVYEQTSYPFLMHEIRLIRQRLAQAQPTLGICLGAQLMAAAAGSRVYPGQAGKEIGWSALRPGADAGELPALTPLLERQIRVLHWHGDTFDLPEGARLLAGSERYANQVFTLGKHGLGFQCHLEVTAAGLESWYIGHACELAGAGIDVVRLREDGRRYAPLLQEAAGQFWQSWLAGIARR
ncbi:glutamine amidotransferase [Martelella alba]|uniref:Glutamine amidotransferase n=1 Tax=Martelella alba TaxID=2590451 RepID=A0ABY2SQX8_9HYPH|nr:glutamine amidotransferase [Martelella alba]TKI07231.1 glutamine amidotransferase [Martelella alba]